MPDERVPHPSELLEFMTIASHGQLEHVDHVEHDDGPSNGSPGSSSSRSRARSSDASPNDNDDIMSDEKLNLSDEKATPHPSELLEFATIAPHGQVNQFEHVEHADAPGKNESPLKSPIVAGPNDGKTDIKSGKKFSVSARGSSDPQSLSNAIDSTRAGIEAEHRLTITQALGLYPKAIGWSVLLSLTIVMEGYDLTIVNSFYALPQFQKRYGIQVTDQEWEITTAWQSALTNGAIVGEILGLLFNGYLTERFGYRWTLVGALLFLCCFIFLAVFAADISYLMASEALCGLSWGVFQTLSTTYAAEIMPVSLRAYLTSNVNLCWLIGQIIGTGVLRGLINLDSEWSYRIPFSLQWVWALPILVGVMFAPESPWWLIRHGHHERAKTALLRLTTRGRNFNADETVQLMIKTNEVEKDLSAGISYVDCFKGVNLRRTEIACVVWITQTMSGGAMTGYAAYFYRQAGFNTERAFDLSLGMYGMAIVGMVISWFLMPVVGRRTLYLWGCALMLIVLIIGGIVGSQADAPWVQWTLGSLIIILTFVYDTTIGPVCYSLVAEIPSTRLRVKTVVLARVAYNIAGVFSNIVMPQMLNPTAWNWKGKTCFLWAGTCLVCLIWCWFRLPEPKGLTYLEMDLLFEKRVKARKFRRITHTLYEAGYFDITAHDQEGLSDWRQT